MTFIPTVSRPADPLNAGWTGRVGRVETIVAPVIEELGLRPDDTVAYLCGNPDMILSVEATLLGLGFEETAVKKELYWPKGKEPRGVAAPPIRRPRPTPRRRTPTSSDDASGVDAGSQVVLSALASSDNLDRGPACARHFGQLVELGIAVGWVVVEEDESANPRQLGEGDRLADRAVTPADPHRVLVVRVLSVVDQEIDA